ncbi:MAG: diacylglycerol kinase family protein [Parcubacteria group bacterium]|nr:diacylglycerol kinase family protein [Parcubacteria group bacterium]
MFFSFRKWLRSFKFAWQGIRFALTQQNFVLMLIIATGTIGLGLYLGLSYYEWLILILIIGLILSLETFNTIWEKTLDFLEPNHSLPVKNIKDLAAGAVVIACFSALIIGSIIFLPKIWQLFNLKFIF